MGGYVGSIAYSTFVGLLLKLAASAFQQEVIGGGCYKYVSVRQAVGINSKTMKSIRIMLTEPGFSISKTAMLLGKWYILCFSTNIEYLPRSQKLLRLQRET